MRHIADVANALNFEEPAIHAQLRQAAHNRRPIWHEGFPQMNGKQSIVCEAFANLERLTLTDLKLVCSSALGHPASVLGRIE